MEPFDWFVPDAVTIGFLEAGHDDRLPDGWVHEKLAPATIVAVVKRGRYEVFSGGHRTVTGEGEAFLAQDRQPLRIVHHGRRTGEHMRAHWLHVRFALFHTVDLVSLLALPPGLDSTAAKPFASIIEELAGKPASQPLERCARRIELGFRALRLLAAIAPMGPAGTALLEQAGRLAPVLTFIKNHLRDPLTVEDLARAAHLSRSRCFAFFQTHLGLPPMAYLKEVRLTEAKNMLLTGDAKLAAIAEATGFANPFHLSREFKRRLGASPAEFRRRHRPLQV
jgi:AraC-like DNA-binding protein